MDVVNQLLFNSTMEDLVELIDQTIGEDECRYPKCKKNANGKKDESRYPKVTKEIRLKCRRFENLRRNLYEKTHGGRKPKDLSKTMFGWDVQLKNGTYQPHLPL